MPTPTAPPGVVTLTGHLVDWMLWLLAFVGCCLAWCLLCYLGVILPGLVRRLIERRADRKAERLFSRDVQQFVRREEAGRRG